MKDLNGEKLDGTFYQEELQKTNLTLYVIEKIIETKNGKTYVKWRGYSNNFNSWIDKKDRIKYTLDLQFKLINMQFKNCNSYHKFSKMYLFILELF